MGVGVSSWVLARAVASQGELGVVSGTALDSVLVRRLALGDPGAHVRRAMEAFPFPEIARQVRDRYFVHPANLTEPPSPFKLLPLPRAVMTPERQWLLVLANFVEVWLAKEGHAGKVGINHLHKIQFPILPSLYGAMLADVDVVLMGAGIPGDIPPVLDRLTRHEPVSVALDVLEAGEQKYTLDFDPRALVGAEAAILSAPLKRPRFLAIISSATLARALLKKAPGGIDGFVVEAPTAGGHNAPPRGQPQLSARGEPVYSERDAVDFAQMAQFGVPFWLAGGYASPEKFQEALSVGAHGVQLGTAFAFCEESGLDPDVRRAFLESLLDRPADVFTDPAASPTSFPFKVASFDNSLSQADVYQSRPRLCDLGYLRRAYRKPDGTLDYRCPGEPAEDYIRKGGKPEDTVGRKCLCNGLMANIGLGQHRADGYVEPPLITAGDDLACVRSFLAPGRASYHANDVIARVLAAARG
jgi:nitronate monooxygenase